MVKVYWPATLARRGIGEIPAAFALILVLVLAVPSVGFAQTTKGAQRQGESDAEPVMEQAEPIPDDPKDGEPDQDAPAPVDPAETQKITPVEVFKDPLAEELLDLKKFNPIRNKAAMPADVEKLKAMSLGAGATVDQDAMKRVIAGMIAEMTETKNLQAMIDPPPKTSPSTVRAVERATKTLMEPIFVARANKNNAFLATYAKNLLPALTPLLKHHLIPRIQAMIILAQTGSPDVYKTFVDEIKNDNQTYWVKLWALRGLTNIESPKINPTPRLSASQEVDAALTISKLLEKDTELPWPVQYRALEALTALRQGFVPSSPKTADMATTAMRFLADPKGRPEVRAEAARALGYMQISSAVTDYNFPLVSHAIGQLAARIGDLVVGSYADTGTPINASRAEAYTALLVGPIYQSFEGQQDVRDSGLLRNSANTSRTKSQEVHDQIKPVTKAAVELVKAPRGQLAERRKDLEVRVGALKEYLAKNAPKSPSLVPGGDSFLDAGSSDEQADATEPASPKVARGAR